MEGEGGEEREEGEERKGRKGEERKGRGAGEEEKEGRRGEVNYSEYHFTVSSCQEPRIPQLGMRLGIVV